MYAEKMKDTHTVRVGGVIFFIFYSFEGGYSQPWQNYEAVKLKRKRNYVFHNG